MGGTRSLSKMAQASCFHLERRRFSSKPSYSSSAKTKQTNLGMDEDVPTAGISRPLSDILKDLNKKVPESLLKARSEPYGFSLRYVPWHILNRISNLHAPGMHSDCSESQNDLVRSAASLIRVMEILYRLSIASHFMGRMQRAWDEIILQVYETKSYFILLLVIFRESTRTAALSDTSYGGPVQKAEAMAFRRACARLGLGLHLYHEEQE